MEEYSNGDRYEGEWLKGVKCGSGTMMLSNNTIVEGEFLNNLLNGHARLET